MAVYLITYDLNNETIRPPIVKEIKESFDSVKLSESSYAVSTTSVGDEQISKHTDEDDLLFLLRIRVGVGVRNQ